MASKIAYICCINLLLIFGGAAARAQDFTVVTETEDLNAHRVVGRSLTIFHAGEAYDRVAGFGEFTIFQPGRQQFTLFSESRMLATTISFKDIMDKQRDFDRQIESYITLLKKRGAAEALQMAGQLDFQLRPEFQERFDAKRNLLSMTSEFYSYNVQVDTKQQPKIVDDYLRYADWTKRLNALLDPRAIFPAPRLIVNQTLRSRGAMPVTVTLKHPGPNGMHYQSRHLIRWKLTESDKEAVVTWNRRLADKDMRWVSFNEFQKAVRPDPND